MITYHIHGPRGVDFGFVGEIPIEREKSVHLSNDDVGVANVEGVDDEPVVQWADEGTPFQVNVVYSKTSRGHGYHHVDKDVQLKNVNWFQIVLVLFVYFVYHTERKKINEISVEIVSA